MQAYRLPLASQVGQAKNISRAFIRPHQILRYATTSTSSSAGSRPKPTRKHITITSDTGQVPWTDLSIREKAARGTQQSLNLAIVLLGIGLTAGVATILWLEVVSPESKTAVFNTAVDKVRAHPAAVRALIGRHEGRIEAHGDASLTSRLDRNRSAA